MFIHLHICIQNFLKLDHMIILYMLLNYKSKVYSCVNKSWHSIAKKCYNLSIYSRYGITPNKSLWGYLISQHLSYHFILHFLKTKIFKFHNLMIQRTPKAEILCYLEYWQACYYYFRSTYIYLLLCRLISK